MMKDKGVGAYRLKTLEAVRELALGGKVYHLTENIVTPDPEDEHYFRNHPHWELVKPKKSSKQKPGLPKDKVGG